MNKKLCLMVGLLIVKGLSAGDEKPRKVLLVRASKPANKKNINADERFFVNVKGSTAQTVYVSAKEIIQKKSDDSFRLPPAKLPLQKE